VIRKTAQALSVAFHPLLHPTLLLLVITFFAPLIVSPLNTQVMLKITSMIFIITALLPVLSILAFKYSASIRNFELIDHKERVIPFFFISLIYCLPTYLFYSKIRVSQLLIVIFAAISIMLLLLTVITIFWKISIHSAGISGLAGFLVGINIKIPESSLFYPMLVIIILAGAVMSARLYLNSHNPAEIFGGAVLGFLISFSSLYFFI
jgi:hypothetical protein